MPLVTTNAKLATISLTGKIPAFTPPVGGGQRKCFGGYKSVSPEDKVAFVIKQLTEDVRHVDWKSGKTLFASQKHRQEYYIVNSE